MVAGFVLQFQHLMDHHTHFTALGEQLFRFWGGLVNGKEHLVHPFAANVTRRFRNAANNRHIQHAAILHTGDDNARNTVRFISAFLQAANHAFCGGRICNHQHSPLMNQPAFAPQPLLPQNPDGKTEYDMQSKGQIQHNTGVFHTGMQREHIDNQNAKYQRRMLHRLRQFNIPAAPEYLLHRVKQNSGAQVCHRHHHDKPAIGTDSVWRNTHAMTNNVGHPKGQMQAQHIQ